MTDKKRVVVGYARVATAEQNDSISREALIKKIFPYGMPDDGNYPINAKAVMKAILEAEAVGQKKI